MKFIVNNPILFLKAKSINILGAFLSLIFIFFTERNIIAEIPLSALIIKSVIANLNI